MSTLIEAIRQILVDNSEVYALAGDRIIADRLPQGYPTPAILLWVNSERALDHLGGPLGMDQPLVRVACYAQSRIVATQVRLAVRKALGGYYGISRSLLIKGIAQETSRGEVQTTDRVTGGTDQYRFVSVQDFRVTYDTEAVTP